METSAGIANLGIVPPGAPTVTPASIADGATFALAVPEPVGVPCSYPGDCLEKLRAAKDKLAGQRTHLLR